MTAGALLVGVGIGFSLALFLSGMIMFRALQERCYVWYGVVVIFLTGYLLLIQPMARIYLSQVPLARITAVARMVLGGSLIAAGCFARSYFHAVGDASELVRSERLVFGSMLFGASLIWVGSAGQGGVARDFFVLLALAAVLLLAAASAQAWSDGLRPARFVLFASLLAMAAGMFDILVAKGALSAFAHRPSLFEAGCVGAVALLAGAMGDNVKVIRHERESLRVSERRHMMLAVTDALTGLFNMRYFRVQIDLEVQRAERLGQPLTMMMMDIDHFKVFNDRHGHLEGDRVLRSLGRLIQSAVREKDVACRYGGEEFAVILPGSGWQTAVAIHDRLRGTLRQQGGSSDAARDEVTLSVGVAEYLSGDTADDLIARADDAMYAAKQGGRNRLVLDLGPEQVEQDAWTDLRPGL